MPRRVNPIVLLGLIVVSVLSAAIFANARTGGGGADAALGTAMGQIGTPYGYGTDGGGSFSCTGLVRHALRSAGVDPNAPWDHMAYLSVYPTVSEPAPGDVVVYPDGVAMYAGDGTVVMANEVDQVVGTYGMNEVGTPVGFARPYGGTLDPTYGGTLDPESDAASSNPAADTPVAPVEQAPVEPVAQDPAAIDPTLVEQPMLDQPVVDPVVVDPAAVEPAAVEPIAVDPVAVDPAML